MTKELYKLWLKTYGIDIDYIKKTGKLDVKGWIAVICSFVSIMIILYMCC